MEGETASSDGSMRTSARRNATKLLEDVGELEKINERHVEFVLPQMKSLDSQLKCSQERAAELKMRQQLHVYHRLRSISLRFRNHYARGMPKSIRKRICSRLRFDLSTL